MSDDGFVETVDRVAELGRQGFYDRAASQNLGPLWRVLHGLVTESPNSPAIPAHWAYADVRPYLLEACDLISTQESQRRVLILENPGLTGQSKITRNLFAGLQIIRPGEIAPSHRHVASALRFIVEGQGAYTAVDGERTYMMPGDFVITPSWTWHDHGNETNEIMVWLDGLDMHIVNMCDASFREDWTGAPPEPTRPVDAAMAQFGAGVLPDGYKARGLTSPIFNYPYRKIRDSLEVLSRLEAPNSYHGHKMRYINPVDGSDAMPTLTTAMQMLAPGFRTAPYRSTAGTVYSVVEGEGSATIGGLTISWAPRDVFVVPSWCSVEIEAASQAFIFSYSDRVVQEKLGFFREQFGNDY